MIQQKETATTSHREVCPRHLCSTPRIHVRSVNKDFNSVLNFVGKILNDLNLIFENISFEISN